MSLPKTVASVLSEHVTLEVESIDRMYLNVYVPKLQCEMGVVGFFRGHRGATFASSVLMDPITRAFVNAIDKFTAKASIPMIVFPRGQRKDDIAKEHLARFTGEEGVLLVGKAQEKTPVFRTISKRSPNTGKTYPWLTRSTAMVNNYYFYCVDRDFGPFFLKYCSYFPYNAKLCINGHEYLKRQLSKMGVEHQSLDNGIASCSNPELMQQICDELSADKIEALLAKWQRIVPYPFTPHDHNAGYYYDISILQAEFSLTQVLDRPVSGRIFFEQVIRDNLDIGRPDQMQLIFARRVTKRTPGRGFRTRVLTDGVVPSLHLDYKNTRIKQYHKEGRALRTETTINQTRDFAIGKKLVNLPALRAIGFQANRRLLDVQRISCDPAIGEATIRGMQNPIVVNGARISALPFADERAQALLQALPVFRLQPNGFTSKELRRHLAPLMGKTQEQITQGQMTYDLRRLRLRGIIERIPRSHRYCVTDQGLRIALYYTQCYCRILRLGISKVVGTDLDTTLAPAFRAMDRLFQTCQGTLKLAA